MLVGETMQPAPNPASADEMKRTTSTGPKLVADMANMTTGAWRIESMEVWDRAATDLLGPAQLDITADGLGSLSFVAIRADLDCRFDTVDGVDRVEFSWKGDDEGRAVSGRGRSG